MANFDELAATWDDDPAKLRRARVAAGAIGEALTLSPRMRVLEYGAGTGLLSQELAESVGSLTLADPSPGMREVVRQKIAAGILPDAEVVDLDVARDGVAGKPFDLVVTMMALHHVPDLAPVLAYFARCLNDGGSLCVIDLEAEDGSFHDPDFEGHHGFDPDELSAQLVEAGFASPRFRHLYELEKRDRKYGLFLATCERRPTTG